jgi:hypothetical protein
MLVAALSAIPAIAQTTPSDTRLSSKTIRVIVGLAPGGAAGT